MTGVTRDNNDIPEWAIERALALRQAKPKQTIIQVWKYRGSEMTNKINRTTRDLVKKKLEAVRADLQVLKAQEQLLVDLLRDSEGRP